MKFLIENIHFSINILFWINARCFAIFLFTHNPSIPFLIRMVTVKAFAVPAQVPRRSQFCRTIGQPLIFPQTHQYPDTPAETLGCDLLASFLRFTATYNSCRELFSRPTHSIRRKGETSFLKRIHVSANNQSVLYS